MTDQSRLPQSIGSTSVVADNASVLFEQYVIPRYRVPFFAVLAENVDLLVVASTERRFDGVAGVRSPEVRDFVACHRHFNSAWHKARTYLAWRNKREHLLGLDGFVLYSSHTARYDAAVCDAPSERISVARIAGYARSIGTK